MTGSIIPLRGDPHQRVASLLPWFVNGGLDEDEHAEVEAHLRLCPACQAAEADERLFKADIAGLPVDVEQGWQKLHDRLGKASRPVGGRLGSPRWMNSALGLRAAAIVLLLASIPAVRGDDPARAPRYHALSAPPGPVAGNALVMFRPETPERMLRASLQAGQARVVDGPTTAGAYVIRLPADRRSALLATLRARRDVILAQPIDQDPP